MNDLARQAPAGLTQGQRFSLVRIFSESNFRFFDRDVLDLFGEHLEVYAPMMVESQRPLVTVNRDLCTWFRLNAPDTLHAQMCSSLREWFTTGFSLLPYGSVSLVAGSAYSVQRQIARARVEAAGQLALYGDLEAELLVREFAGSLESSRGLSPKDRKDLQAEADRMLRRFARLREEAAEYEG
jgi:hypothetical protein